MILYDLLRGFATGPGQSCPPYESVRCEVGKNRTEQKVDRAPNKLHHTFHEGEIGMPARELRTMGSSRQLAETVQITWPSLSTLTSSGTKSVISEKCHS